MTGWERVIEQGCGLPQYNPCYLGGGLRNMVLTALLQCELGDMKPWSHRTVGGCLSYVSCWVWEGGSEKLWGLCLCVCETACFVCVKTEGLWCWPWTLQGTGGLDNRAQCPSVLNRKMRGIKRQCSPVYYKLSFTSHIRGKNWDQQPQTEKLENSIDFEASAAHFDYCTTERAAMKICDSYFRPHFYKKKS